MNNWFDYILFHMRTRPEQPAIVMEDRVVTYGMLNVGVERCARRIASAGIAGDSPVAILVGNPVRHVTLVLALTRIGIPSVSLEHGQSGIGGLTFAAVLGDEAAKPVINPGNRFVGVTDEWFGTDAGGSSLPDGFFDGEQICHVAPTSGTTGQPKLVGLSINEVGSRIVGFNGYNWSLLLCLPGLSSLWSYVAACVTLATGRTLCFSASPFQSIRMIELFSIDYMLAATEQLLALTRAARKTGAQMPSLRLIEVSGSVPTASLLEAAMVHLCKDIYCRYGTSELGQMARAFAREVLSRPGFVGHVMPGIEIAIVDRGGKPCPPGETGLVRSRLDPRWNAPSHLGAGEHDRWTDLGDLGWMSDRGELHILGREADAMADRLQGATARLISPVHEVEHLLRLEWDATDAAAVMADDAGDQRPQIWIGLVDCKDASAEKLEPVLRSRGIDFSVRLFPLPAIPRGTNGKVQRAQLKSLMLAAAGPARRA
jgi:acyl-coenzyme A synthetase/AMP-(fatty) acid ligase